MPSAIDKSNLLPVYFIGHAGVGLLFKDDENNDTVKDNLRSIDDEIRAISPTPKAILAFSGHFEAGEIHGPGVIEGGLCKSIQILVCRARLMMTTVNVKRNTPIQVSAT